MKVNVYEVGMRPAHCIAAAADWCHHEARAARRRRDYKEERRLLDQEDRLLFQEYQARKS